MIRHLIKILDILRARRVAGDIDAATTILDVLDLCNKTLTKRATNILINKYMLGIDDDRQCKKYGITLNTLQSINARSFHKLEKAEKELW